MNLGVRIRGSVGDIELVNMVPFQGLRRVLSLILPGRILNFSLAELETPNKHKHSIIGRLHYKSFFVCMMSIFAFSSITIISAIVVNTIDINKIVRWRARVFFFLFFLWPLSARAPCHWLLELFFAVVAGREMFYCFFVAPCWVSQPFGGAGAK